MALFEFDLFLLLFYAELIGKLPLLIEAEDYYRQTDRQTHRQTEITAVKGLNNWASTKKIEPYAIKLGLAFAYNSSGVVLGALSRH